MVWVSKSKINKLQFHTGLSGLLAESPVWTNQRSRLHPSMDSLMPLQRRVTSRVLGHWPSCQSWNIRSEKSDTSSAPLSEHPLTEMFTCISAEAWQACLIRSYPYPSVPQACQAIAKSVVGTPLINLTAGLTKEESFGLIVVLVTFMQQLRFS